MDGVESSGGVSVARSVSEEKKDIKERAEEGKGTHQTRHHTGGRTREFPYDLPQNPQIIFFLFIFLTCHASAPVMAKVG